jgi:hypothetical protein
VRGGATTTFSANTILPLLQLELLFVQVGEKFAVVAGASVAVTIASPRRTPRDIATDARAYALTYEAPP